MPITLTNALLVDLDPPRVENGMLRIEGNKITGRGRLTPQPNDEIIDCAGAVVIPGLVNGHAHLYASLAVGMPPPPQPPQNFIEILEQVWWKLDQALDPDTIQVSATLGALEAARCGTTTIIDHHASPNCIHGSLDRIEAGLAQIGLRGILCYETTDRHGPAGREAGLAENQRYIEKNFNSRNGRFAGMVGGHALFTLDDQTLNAMRELAEGFNIGIHIHVAEDPHDENVCQEQHQQFLADRLAGQGLMLPESIYAHGTHLDAETRGRLADAGLAIAHCPRSNMNNGVGYAPVRDYNGPTILGTDGIGNDMLAEARTAFLKAADEVRPLPPDRVLRMLADGARRASDTLDVTLGKLEPEAAADIVITDYVPATPLENHNLAGHLLFAIHAAHVRHVLADGRWIIRERSPQTINDSDLRATTRAAAQTLWSRV